MTPNEPSLSSTSEKGGLLILLLHAWTYCVVHLTVVPHGCSVHQVRSFEAAPRVDLEGLVTYFIGMGMEKAEATDVLERTLERRRRECSEKASNGSVYQCLQVYTDFFSELFQLV